MVLMLGLDSQVRLLSVCPRGVLSPYGGSEEEWFVFIYVMQEFVLVGVMVAGLVMAATIMIVMFKLMIRKMVTSEIAEVIIIIVIGGNYFRN